MDHNRLDTTELRELREQLDILKDKLQKEEIVNRKIIRNAMNSAANSLQRQRNFFVVAGLFAILYTFWGLDFIGLSLHFRITTVLFLLIAVIHTFWSHHGLSRSDFATEELITLGRRVASLKRRYSTWLYFSIPFLVLWLGWFVWELTGLFTDRDFLISLFVGMAVGGIVGGIVGINKHRAVQRNATQLLQHIDALTSSSTSEEL